MEEKKCYVCGRTKSLKSFYKLKNSKDGHMPRCKICANQYNRLYRQKKNNYDDKDKKLGYHLKFSIPKKEDYCFMYMIMQKLNYDLDVDVSLQFCERHGLTYQPRKSPKETNRFTKDEC